MNAQEAQNIKWSENIIIADGDYIDHVAFDIIVNFERMLDRRIPAADFSQWAVDVPLASRDPLVSADRQVLHPLPTD